MRLVGGVVGAVIGFYMGNPAIGWAIGSAIGGAVEGPQKFTQEGPRLDDLTVSNSNFGIGKPRVYGRKRIAGNVIRSTPRKEYVKYETQSSGGKGGGGSETTTKTYHYRITIAFALAEKLDAMTRIWYNGKLIYDKTINNSGLIGDIGGKLTFYKGTEDQLPDPALQREFGVENVTAYRGTSYVVFDNLELEEFYNNVPSLIFEVVSVPDGVDVQQKKYNVFDFNKDYKIQGGELIYSPIDGFIYGSLQNTGVSDYTCNIVKIDPFSFSVLNSRRINYSQVIHNINYLDNGDLLLNNVYQQNSTPNKRGWVVLDSETLTVKQTITENSFFAWQGSTGLAFGTSNKTITIRDQKIGTRYFNVCGITKNGRSLQVAVMQKSGDFLIGVSNYTIPVNYSTLGTNVTTSITAYYSIYTMDSDLNIYYLNISLTGTLRKLHLARNGTDSLVVLDENNLNENYDFHDIYLDNVSRSLFVLFSKAGKLRLIKFNIDTEEILSNVELKDSVNNSISITGTNPKFMFDSKERRLIFNFRETTTTKRCIYYYSIDNDNHLVLPYENNSVWGDRVVSNHVKPCYVENIGAEFYVSQSSTIADEKILVGFGLRDVPQGYALDKCVLDIIKSEEYDRTIIDNVTFDLNKVKVDELRNDIVEGYVIANPSTRRTCLEQLQFVFDFYMVQSNFNLEFRKYKSDIVANLSTRNLSVIQNQEDLNYTTNLLKRQTQEIEKPKTVNIKYPSIERDYETSTQSTSNEYVFSTDIATIDVPIVMYDKDAANLSSKTLERYYINGDSYEFQTNYDYFMLEVGDVITITDADTKAVFTMRISKKEMDAGIIKWQAIDEDSSVFVQDRKEETGGNIKQEIENNSQSKLAFLDIPILKNEDDDPGVYVATVKTNKNLSWRGSSVLSSGENIGPFYEQTTLFNEAKMGSVVNALGDFKMGNITDTINSIEVTLISGTLESVTDDDLLNGYNMCVVGNEILQFKNAVMISENTYQLSTFLRGRRGTEQHISNHQQGEKFVMLPMSNGDVIKRIFKDNVHLGAKRFIKNVTLGQIESTARATEYVNSGNGLKPYAVNNVDGFSDVNGDKVCKFNKSVRGYAPLQDLRDAYDPDGDLYEIEIYKDNTYTEVLRLLTIGNLNFRYTASEQIADFGAIQSNVYIKIFKLGKIIGRGFETKAVI